MAKATPTKAVAGGAKFRGKPDDVDEDGAKRKPPRGDGTISRGWGAAEKQMDEAGGFTKTVQIKSGDLFIIRFLEDEPYAVYRMHWVGPDDRRRSYICLGAKCPLCAIGHEPDGVKAFNVVKLTDGEPIHYQPRTEDAALQGSADGQLRSVGAAHVAVLGV